MGYYDNQAEYQPRGIDYDLGAAIEYNSGQGYEIEDIECVIAVRPGERDEQSWHWILLLKDGRHVYAHGGCDYTGWD